MEEIRPFGNLSPRLSLTYDLFGNGKTALKAAGGYYYKTRETLADNLGGLYEVTRLQFTNANSGLCSGTNACWTDANMDGIVQASELVGLPTSPNSRFNLNTGIFSPVGNAIDPDTQIARTREAIVGVQHELIPNLAVSVDYIYRKYDRGLTTYTLGYQPGAPGYPLSQIYTGPLYYTDPVTGNVGEYYAVRDGAYRPTGLGSITMTSPNYQVYNGVDIVVTKRYTGGWQLNGALTIQDNPNYFPDGSPDFVNPTGRAYREGVSTIAKYVLKLSGSYDLPFGITAAGNFNMFQGGTRTLVMDAPLSVYGGVNASGVATPLSYTTLEFQPRDSFRFEDTKMLDLSLQQNLSLGEKYRLKLMVDLFNVLNINEVQSYSSQNVNAATFTSPSSIIPPRVLRFGARITF